MKREYVYLGYSEKRVKAHKGKTQILKFGSTIFMDEYDAESYPFLRVKPAKELTKNRKPKFDDEDE